MNELSRELGLPGEVLAFHSKQNVICELKALVDKFEAEGHKSFSTVKDGEDKQRFKKLSELLGIKCEW